MLKMKNEEILNKHFDLSNEDKLNQNNDISNYCDIYLDDNFLEFENTKNYKFVKSIRFKKIKEFSKKDIKKIIELL